MFTAVDVENGKGEEDGEGDQCNEIGHGFAPLADVLAENLTRMQCVILAGETGEREGLRGVAVVELADGVEARQVAVREAPSCAERRWGIAGIGMGGDRFHFNLDCH